MMIGLTPAETADWTPGMVYDMVFYKANKLETQKEPEKPSQSYFDNF